MSEKTYSADLSITANLTGGALLGQFSDVGVSQIEASRCQTGTYYDGDATVPFEAKRYFRPGEPGAGVPVAGEDPAYFSRNGPLELFIRSQAKKVVIRGALVSRCKFGGDHKSTRSPLFGVPYTLQLDGKRSFSREFKKNAGRVHGDVINEVTRISGTVGEAAIDGTYLRRSVTGEGVAARSCTLGPLHFHADRFLPPAG
jgi:hypothetical protein